MVERSKSTARTLNPMHVIQARRDVTDFPAPSPLQSHEFGLDKSDVYSDLTAKNETASPGFVCQIVVLRATHTPKLY